MRSALFSAVVLNLLVVEPTHCISKKEIYSSQSLPSPSSKMASVSFLIALKERKNILQSRSWEARFNMSFKCGRGQNRISWRNLSASASCCFNNPKRSSLILEEGTLKCLFAVYNCLKATSTQKWSISCFFRRCKI